MIAFLEQILLDGSGNIRERYRDEGERHQSVDASQNGSCAVREAAIQPYSRVTTAPSTEQPQTTCSTSPHQDETAKNPLKRKFDEPEDERWLFATEELDLVQHLPPQAVLLKVIDFFTTSIHHWIPYLHKQRLRDKVSEGICSNGLLLVLHALVAVTMRHMHPLSVHMDNDQIQRQCGVSRTIVETHAIRSVSIESLQALIFLVFDYVSAHHSIFLAE